MKVLYENPNFLIFDEPTNDLDLPTLTVLENFLLNFQGCVIIVSHDRYFMDRIVDHVLAFEGEGKIRDFVGNFSEYREKIRENRTENQERQAQAKTDEPQTKSENPATSNQKPSTKKLSFKEQRELETIEKEMPKLEEKRADILKKLNNESDYEKISKLSGELQTVSDELGEMEMRWLELQEMQS